MAAVSSLEERRKVLQQRIRRGRRRWLMSWILFFLVVVLVALLALMGWRQVTRRHLIAAALLSSQAIREGYHASLTETARLSRSTWD